MGRPPRHLKGETHGSLTTTLHPAIGRFHEDDEVAVDEVRAPRGNLLQAVVLGRDLLTLIERPSDIPHRILKAHSQGERDGDTALHVARAPTHEVIPVRPLLNIGRQVLDDRNGVEVTSNDDPFRTPKVSTGNDRVTESRHLKMPMWCQRLLHSIGNRRLVHGHRLDVDESTKELVQVARRLQVHAGHPTSVATDQSEENVRKTTLRLLW